MVLFQLAKVLVQAQSLGPAVLGTQPCRSRAHGLWSGPVGPKQVFKPSIHCRWAALLTSKHVLIKWMFLLCHLTCPELDANGTHCRSLDKVIFHFAQYPKRSGVWRAQTQWEYNARLSFLVFILRHCAFL